MNKQTFTTDLKKLDPVFVVASLILLILSVIYLFTTTGSVLIYILVGGISIYGITKNGASKHWKVSFILLLIAFILFLLGHLLRSTFIITIILFAIGSILLAISCAIMTRRIENKVISIVSLSIAFAFAVNAIFWILLPTGVKVRPLYSVTVVLEKFSFILLSIVICWLGIKKETILSDSTYKRPKLIAIAIACLTLVVAAFAYNQQKEYYDELEYEQNRPHYKGIYSALSNGDIRYGITYSEISNICGPADRTSRRNGVVEFAYYGNVQLCFENGRFDHWND